jgi:hypothetical protein
MSIVPTVLRNDLLRMRDGKIYLLSILEVEFLLEIPTMFDLHF